jgi:hypothetical protein|nr:MAG TPA: hypothetical protein [Caudoviricetes sp.]
MKNVYMVTSGTKGGDDYSVEGVFTNLNAAKKYCAISDDDYLYIEDTCLFNENDFEWDEVYTGLAFDCEAYTNDYMGFRSIFRKAPIEPIAYKMNALVSSKPTVFIAGEIPTRNIIFDEATAKNILMEYISSLEIDNLEYRER